MSLRLDIHRSRTIALALLVLTALGLGSPPRAAAQSPVVVERPAIVVTTGILGSIVRDLVEDGATVSVLMGDGVDPHEWSPSAQDIEALHHADLVVVNGLGLEAAIDEVLDEVAASGVPVFRATDHVTLRSVGDIPDPHVWTDPLSMRDVVVALGPVLEGIGVPVTDRQADLVARLEALDAEVRSTLEVVLPERRQLVTGHDSMGYFADRYGFQLIGAVTPGLSSVGEVSASQLGAISALIREHGVPAIFTEIGTPQAVVDAIAGETGVRVVPLPSHTLPADGSYLTFIRDIATAIAGALG